MWKCSKCGELLEEQIDACWKCKTPRTGESRTETLPAPNPMQCPRCGRVELFIDGIGEEFRPH